MTSGTCTTTLSTEERNAIFRSLRQLKRHHEGGMNKDELAELLIGAAILNGFDRGKRIAGTLATLGLNRRHAGIILDRLTGIRWHRADGDRYSLID